MIKLNPEFVMRNIAGEVVIVPVGNASQKINGLITLNESALFIWECLEKGNTRDDIVNLLVKEFEVDKKIAKQDCDGFIRMLLQYGFAEEEEDN